MNQTRHERIAVQAYYLAEKRGFMPGAELDDWLAAEGRIDAQPSEPPADDHLEHARRSPRRKAPRQRREVP